MCKNNVFRKSSFYDTKFFDVLNKKTEIAKTCISPFDLLGLQKNINHICISNIRYITKNDFTHIAPFTC